jgi:hypothetical protein
VSRGALLLAALLLSTLPACKRQVTDSAPNSVEPQRPDPDLRSPPPSPPPPAPAPAISAAPAAAPAVDSAGRRRCVPEPRSGCDWTYNQGSPRVPSPALVKTIKRSISGWRSVERKPVTRTIGIAGGCPFTSAQARLVKGDKSVKLDLLDAIRACACEPGKPWLLKASHGRRRVKAAGVDAVQLSVGSSHDLTLVVADCCRLTLSGKAPVTAQDLIDAAAIINVKRLQQICTARK